VLVGVCGACAHKAAPPTTVATAAPPPAAAAATTRLVWLPLEQRKFAVLATSVNDRLARVAIDGVTDVVQAPISMEMAQLTIECINRSPACYGAVGRSMKADRLLWADVQREEGGAVTINVSLFDVGTGVIARKFDQKFASEDAARAGISGAMDGVLTAWSKKDGAAK